MFCPECKSEYRRGFTRCSDCDVALVEALPASDSCSFPTLKRVWSGKDEERCVTLCKRLQAVGIPFRVDQGRRQYLLRIEQHYAIGVPAEFFDKARKVMTKGRLDVMDGAEDE
jgi:hypothetical protein